MNIFHCTRCEGTGFLNLDQVDKETLGRFEETGDPQVILDWINNRNHHAREAGGCSYHVCLPHDVTPCDCCGDGEDWYSLPGLHDWDNPDDPKGCR